jgi:alanyl-tRNA synthetase
LVFAQNSKAGKDINALLKRTFEQFPGKGGGTKDFARGALISSSDSQLALALAEK